MDGRKKPNFIIKSNNHVYINKLKNIMLYFKPTIPGSTNLS